MTQPVLTHVALNCADVQRSIDFYCRYAQMHVVHDREDAGLRVAWVGRDAADPTFVLVLIENAGNQPALPPAVDHLGFACATRDEVDALAAAAAGDGVEVVLGPVEWPPPVGYITIIADPDGNRVEFSYGQTITPRMR